MAVFRLVVGLGNPSRQYKKTKHNAGFWFLDELAKKYSLVFAYDGRFHGDLARLDLHGETVLFLKPTTFMNHSGRSLSAVVRYYKIAPETVLVVHDELDFAPGVIRFKKSGGHGGHNGLKDIITHIQSRDFFRLRIGIGRPEGRENVVRYVLSEPSISEGKCVLAALARAADFFPALLEGRFEDFMNAMHRS